MEQVSGDDLESFFNQWIFTKGHPELKWTWKYENGNVMISIDQVQDYHIFNFPIEIGIVVADDVRIESLNIGSRSNKFKISCGAKPKKLVLDPECWLLFEEKN